MKFLCLKEKYHYYVVFLLFVTLKIFYIESKLDNLGFILRPLSSLISIFTSSKYIYTDKGYYFETLNIIINKSCSGFNFLLICFVIIMIKVLPFVRSSRVKNISIPIGLLVSYLLTLIVNSSRILFSLLILKESIFRNLNEKFSHNIQGILIYISFLLIIYMLIDKKIKVKGVKNEKTN